MSFPRYPKYKPSGVEWLKDVPEHWEVKPLCGCASERCESNKGMIEDNLLSLSYGRIVQKDMSSNDGLLPESFETYQIVRRGDIVFRLTDLQNDKRSLRSAMVEEDGIITSAYLAVKPESAGSRFLAHLFRAYDATKVFYSMGGGLRQSMKYADVKRLPTLLPPPGEQTAIAAFLDRETAMIDGLVAEQRRLLELLKEKRQSVISNAVTKGLNPRAPMKPSGIEWLGDVPEHWSENPLRALFSLKHGYAFDSDHFSDSGEYVLMTPGNFYEWGGFRHKFPEKFYSGADFPREFILESGQMLVAMTEQGPGLLGSSLFVPDGATYLHNQRLGRVHNIRCDKVNEKFLFHLFNSVRYRAEVAVSSTGAKVKHTSPQKILSVKVFLPPISEQKQIGQFLDEEITKTDLLEAEAQRAIDLLQERRTALISAAVTGQIDVRDPSLNVRHPGGSVRA